MMKEECGEDLYYATIYMFCYFLWFIVRNVLVTLISYCFERPLDLQSHSRSCCLCIDAFGMSYVQIYLSETLASE
jgi:hypothetical protein